jgi:hypothetical protein
MGAPRADTDAEVHVYDRDSKETGGVEARKIPREGASYAEVRIPAGFSAASVRKPR